MTAANVDQAEIAKFEALASRWWDLNSEFKPLHDINPLRANFIDLHSPVAGSKLLDVGCGGGILSEAMAQRGAIVSGIDMGKHRYRWLSYISLSQVYRSITGSAPQKS